MNFDEVLRAAASGHHFKRAFGPVLKLQWATVPILIERILTSDGDSKINDNWLMCKYIVIHAVPRETGLAVGAPYAFGDEEVNATDWEVCR